MNRESGEIKQAQVFIACLPRSNYTFVMAVPSQRTDDFLHALTCCLHHLGGSPLAVVSDNLKASVIKADRYEPDLNRLMNDLSAHYGFAVLAARPGKPKDKAAVENEVKIAYRRAYAKLRDRTFFSIEEMNRAFAEKTREHNQTRQQQKGYCREEQFLSEEKPLLKPLPDTPFEVKYYTSLRVSANNCVYLGRDKHHYSVPYQYIGERVEVIYTRDLVRLYVRGEKVATHTRTTGFGYTTRKEHMGSSHNFYKNRNPDYYIKQASKHSDTLAELFAAMFERSEYPELQYKMCDGMLDLQRKTDPVAFEQACRYALEHGILTFNSFKRVIETRAYLLNLAGTGHVQPKHARHVNIRGKGYYAG